jgi:hypothetical protein
MLVVTWRPEFDHDKEEGYADDVDESYGSQIFCLP